VSQTQSITYGDRGFWAYDVAVGVFLKYLIDAAQASREANTPWISQSLESWRLCAVISDYGLTLDRYCSVEQQKTFISLAEEACATLATRDSIPANEISSWPFVDDLRLHPRGAKEVLTEPVIELGRAIVALLCGELPEAPKGEDWLFGTATGRSTLRMDTSWDGRQT
jgi:hypothetical protein